MKCKDAENADAADVADGAPGGKGRAEPTAKLLVNQRGEGSVRGDEGENT